MLLRHVDVWSDAIINSTCSSPCKSRGLDLMTPTTSQQTQPATDVTMRAMANVSSKQLPLVTWHSHGACGFVRWMIRAFICDQCKTLSSSVILQHCISYSLYVASNQMPDCKYWGFTAVWFKAPFSTMIPCHWVIGSRPLEPVHSKRRDPIMYWRGVILHKPKASYPGVT
jgi:hypothetical protein